MKKILSITALCLIAVLAGVIILFACIDKNYNPNIQTPDYIEIYANGTSASAESYYKNDEFTDRKAVYDEVMKLYNESFKQKIMSGIFQGIIFDNAEIKGKEYKNISSLSGTYVVFNYTELQTLKLNGKTYTYKNGSTTETNIQFNALYVEVKDTTAMSDINIYVKYYNQTSNSEVSYYRYVVKAQQSDLYNYIQENFGA